MIDDERPAAQRATVRELFVSWPGIVAVLLDRHLTVIEATALARDVSPGFRPGINIARFAFLDDSVDRSAEDWPGTADQVTALLRDSLEIHEEDSAFREIVGELSALSSDFATAWAAVELRVRQTGAISVRRPGLAELRLVFHLLAVPGDYEDTLVVCRPDDESTRVALAAIAEGTAGGADRAAR